jgi:predicted HTH domain antitoxin
MQVSISELQRMRLRKLQIKLVRQAIQMHYSTDEEAEGWEETLQQYGNVPRIIQSSI